VPTITIDLNKLIVDQIIKTLKETIMTTHREFFSIESLKDVLTRALVDGADRKLLEDLVSKHVFTTLMPAINEVVAGAAAPRPAVLEPVAFVPVAPAAILEPKVATKAPRAKKVARSYRRDLSSEFMTQAARSATEASASTWRQKLSAANASLFSFEICAAEGDKTTHNYPPFVDEPEMLADCSDRVLVANMFYARAAHKERLGKFDAPPAGADLDREDLRVAWFGMSSVYFSRLKKLMADTGDVSVSAALRERIIAYLTSPFVKGCNVEASRSIRCQDGFRTHLTTYLNTEANDV
jgi:hypothetical protein